MPKSARRGSAQRRALSEIKKFQSGKFATSTLIPKSCFSRIARKVAVNLGKPEFRFQDKALDGLQTASEAFLVEMLGEANKICAASDRMTLQGNDLRLAVSITKKQPFDIISQDEHGDYGSEKDVVEPAENNASDGEDFSEEDFSEEDEEGEAHVV